MVESRLIALGLTDTEAKAYLDLADVGKTNAQLLAKRTGLPRTTAYWALDSLVSRGLASIEQKKGTTFYKANKPDALLRMIESEGRQLSEAIARRRASAAELIEDIAPLFRQKHFSVPKLQFFEGEDGVRSMLYDYTPRWQDSIEQYDNTWWGYQDHTFPETYLDWMKATWKLKRKNEVYCVVTNRSAIEDELAVTAAHRNTRYISSGYQFSSTIWIVGEYVVLIMTNQKPHYAFQLIDPVFAQNLRMVFKLMWDTASTN
jgi:sugar-specific transcriptional regulator TrmB